MIPFIDLAAQYAAVGKDIDERIARVLAAGQFIMGPEVAECEAALARFAGAAHCITVASGTEALLIALMTLGVGPGDEVITSAFSFAATAEVIALVGATPVFVDIEPETANIDAARIGERITSRTKAIMPVSLYGQPADMGAINAIGARHGLFVIEDGAQSFGAVLSGKRSCNLSTIGCTSFFPSKPLGCYGDGGALFTDDDTIAQIAREIRTHGQRGRYHHVRIGVGGRMDTLQCAVLLGKLDRFEWELAERTRIGSAYDQAMDRMGMERVQVRPDRATVFAQYSVMHDERERVIGALGKAGIPTAIHYPSPVNRQPAYASFDPAADTPVADRMAARVFSLPMSAYLTDAHQQHVLGSIADALA